MRRIRTTPAAFGARLARRFARRATRSGLAFPLVAPARTLMHHVMHRHTRFGDIIQSRLSFVLHLHRGLVFGDTPRDGQPALAPTVRRARVAVTADLPRRSVAIAERLPRRATRVETAPVRPAAVPVVTRQRSDVVSRTEMAQHVAAMTLPRRPEASSRRGDTNPAAVQVDRAAVTDDRSVRATRSARGRRDEASPSLHEADIERVAERVIGSIDRRIAAQRERLGRF
jgi:hypothetical protein